MRTHTRLWIFAIIMAVSSVMLFAQTKVTGDWYYYNDSNDGGSSKIIIDGSPTTKFSKKTRKIGGSEQSVALLEGKVTTDFEYGFIGMGIKLDENAKGAIKKAKGIRFKAKGKNTFRCKLETTNVGDYDYFGKNFTAGSSVKTVEVRFDKVSQEGWGASKSFSPANVVQISFQTVGQPIADVSLAVYDLEFIM